ncbi:MULTISPECIES: M20/M25/M40 family metallo-hydrolase [Gordonibacter]|uniref:M20/M25/M40 family metallo-hydrolase n=1 Tax=Gordonibacter faecis TaxID=3047475 RepID=A0ABT7DQJ3_9ACTN|nr:MULTISPECIES: M20/M25/M40 family metallo-hydrolase [unclassified Gordonibacter]MDJ1651819.1 M20/M25/M40 family metallo-hydrolase [Gordonibacter sp. KGMB12511]HIW75647.1 M20/M25/M40 family metallo-hydrolase [Candidatus Gordonibacter avicola]
MIVLAVVLALIAVLVVVLVVNAVRLKPTPVGDPLPPSDVRGDDAAVARFQEMLRCPTVWDLRNPNADRSAFDEFVPLLRRLYPRVFDALELELVDGYGIALLWKGADRDLAPVVLMAHHDVVSANADEWTHDPFAAEIADNAIYARGAVDTKCIWAGLLEATEKLLAEGYVPPRDVYLFSSNTEEDGGDTTPHFVQLLQERGRVPYMVLDEGGAVIDNPPLGIQGQFAVVGVAEKGIFNTHITTSAEGGHAATPSLKDATAKLISGLDGLQKNPPTSKLSAPVAAMLRELAARGGFGLRLVFGNLWLFRPLVIRIMQGNSETAAMVRTTYALTQLEGSPAHNIIPKRARATVNVRVDPGETVDIATQRIKDRFDDRTTYELFEVSEPSPIAPFDGDPAFDYLRRVIASVYPTAGIAPYVQSSCSDARHFHRVCSRTYRFAGILFAGDSRSRIHGQDERLDVDAYLRGIGFYTEFIRHLNLLGK